MKYRFKPVDATGGDETVEDSWKRVAKACAAPEPKDKRKYWAQSFYDAMANFRFLPAGRILAGAGTKRDVTLFNCFVMGQIPDTMGGIFENLKEAALTMQQGGGIGYDFSTLRPKGAAVKGVGADASGPLSFMDVWDAMCQTIMSAGSRRGAMMATMACDHPDIEDFIAAKHEAHRLRMFNLSVLVSNDFMAALKANDDWPLKFNGTIYKTIKASALWDQIMQATYDYAEPGVIFIDRINQLNNLNYCETISATNPCGEQPLPPYGACLLGSVNLAQLIENPFKDNARMNLDELETLVTTAVRMMDNVIDISNFPLEQQRKEAQAKRRIGLGITGLADALIMCGLTYGSDPAAKAADDWMTAITQAAYKASIALAEEKGTFPLYDKQAFLKSEFVLGLPEDIQAEIAKHGIRNALLLSIAPTGTISLFADNVSSGIEPAFSLSYNRKILLPDGSTTQETVFDYAYRLYCEKFGDQKELPDYFVTTQTLVPNDHLVMQAAVQKHIDSSISKTINCPADISFDDFKDIYLKAYDLGLKGCTTYRPNDVTGSILSLEETPQEAQETLPLEAPQAPISINPDIDHGVVYMKQPLERQEVLPGFTYKLRWPDSDHAIYVTMNDIVEDNRRRPFEIFINSKNMEHYAWTVALTRMISAVFRRGGDVSFVVEELKAVFDPRGGQWMQGRYVPSLLAAIGGIIEKHMIDIGFLIPPEKLGGPEADKSAQVQSLNTMRYCPKCDTPSLVFQEGCHTCLSCGYSKCS